MPNALERMRSDGLVVFDRLFPLPLLRKLRAEIMRRHESGELRKRLVRDIGGRYTALLPLAGPFLTPALYANPRLLPLVAKLLGEDHCIGSLEVVMSLPGSSRQYQHIDGPLKGGVTGMPPYALALATPLCDVDEDNGPTALWPGSHRVALRSPLPSEREIARRFREVHMTGPFGRSYLYDYRTFHRGLPNMSREPRPLLMLVFTRDWYRDPNLLEMPSSLIIGKKDLAKVPRRHRSLFKLARS